MSLPTFLNTSDSYQESDSEATWQERQPKTSRQLRSAKFRVALSKRRGFNGGNGNAMYSHRDETKGFDDRLARAFSNPRQSTGVGLAAPRCWRVESQVFIWNGCSFAEWICSEVVVVCVCVCLRNRVSIVVVYIDARDGGPQYIACKFKAKHISAA